MPSPFFSSASQQFQHLGFQTPRRDSKRMSSIMPPVVKFNIPASARSFHPFSRLPPEIRSQIWEHAILDPGMHFLRLKTAARVAHIPSPLVALPVDDDDDEERSDPLLDFSRESLPSALWPATLEPRYPTPQANLSNYVTLNRTLSKLSATCFEAATVVRRLINQPGGVKLKGGRVVLLASSSDVVCLEYLSADNFRSWCRMSLDIECQELSNIRHVAIPYCHGWEAADTAFRCSHCGSQHGSRVRKVYPVHLYEFLARHLPNLETFYFIDYLVVKKSRGVSSTGETPQTIDLTTSDVPTPTLAPEHQADRSDKRKQKEDALDENPSSDVTVDPVKAPNAGTVTGTLEADHQVSSSNETRRLGKTFRSEGRIFREVEEDEWNVKSSVVDTLFWIQKRFMIYATGSKLSKHAHPDKVEFKVLACEWIDRDSEIPPRLKRAAPMIRKHVNKRLRPLPETSPRKKALSAKPGATLLPPHPPVTASPVLKDKFEFVFGQESNSAFEFGTETGL
ncbi:hypothetical protein CTA2_10403 [Colletotrichum tanaceti]|uniref:2EXR domain-containing protein n=1 Tax=Colletotrichum tanaceti TaxID=1306861 RepID=A0A4V6DI54_9PEZI|nr:hypothetical protein CTA2_10403 [Colletotrichum tanaceti]TKW59076.1 hypothetical protein CTA1_13368 [Colletotrichum tanaceti]